MERRGSHPPPLFPPTPNPGRPSATTPCLLTSKTRPSHFSPRPVGDRRAISPRQELQIGSPPCAAVLCPADAAFTEAAKALNLTKPTQLLKPEQKNRLKWVRFAGGGGPHTDASGKQIIPNPLFLADLLSPAASSQPLPGGLRRACRQAEKEWLQHHCFWLRPPGCYSGRASGRAQRQASVRMPSDDPPAAIPPYPKLQFFESSAGDLMILSEDRRLGAAEVTVPDIVAGKSIVHVVDTVSAPWFEFGRRGGGQRQKRESGGCLLDSDQPPPSTLRPKQRCCCPRLRPRCRPRRPQPGHSP